MDAKTAENIVRITFPYVAIYNVLMKEAFTGRQQGSKGFNRIGGRLCLADHHKKTIARPNNDTLLASARLDLKAEPMILSLPALDSKYASLESCGLDHYCDVILSSRKGHFRKPVNILFYTDRSQEFHGRAVEEVDLQVKLSTDFAMANCRIMPHATDEARYMKIVDQIKHIGLTPLSTWEGRMAPITPDATFPLPGDTDVAVFGNNLLEILHFVLRHTSFNSADTLDQEALTACAQLGLQPGNTRSSPIAQNVDKCLLEETAKKVTARERSRLKNPSEVQRLRYQLFRPKGEMTVDALLFQSVIGPIGLPAEEALYDSIFSEDGQSINARCDYRIRMTKEQLPPVDGFWSVTLYDTETGFFVPNVQKKYSVGENAGMQLDADGGIEIVIAAEKPDDIPPENWLPIQRSDRKLDLILRMYVPDLDAITKWQPPKCAVLGGCSS